MKVISAIAGVVLCAIGFVAHSAETPQSADPTPTVPAAAPAAGTPPPKEQAEKAAKDKLIADAAIALAEAQKQADEAKVAADLAEKAECKADETKCKPPVLSANVVPDQFGSFGFGAGIGLNWVGKRDIKTAVLTSNNVVDASDSESVIKQLWLESHWLWRGDDYVVVICSDEPSCAPYDAKEQKAVVYQNGQTYIRPARWQPRLFFAVQISDADSLINGAAIGFLNSFQKTTYVDGKVKTRAFNIGIGISSQKIQRLGQGLKEGDAVPAGTPITYRKDDRIGGLLLFSVNVF